MRKRLAAVGLGLILGANGAGAQPLPPAQLPQAPLQPIPPGNAAPAGVRVPGVPQSQTPGMLPPALLSATSAPGTYVPSAPPGQGGAAPGTPPGSSGAAPPANFPLPQPEHKFAISAMDVQVKRVSGGYEVWSGQTQLRTFGENENTAHDVARVYRDLRPTEWVRIGAAKPVVEYGLTNGRPAVAGTAPDNKSDTDEGVQHAGGFGHAAVAAGAKLVQPIDMHTARVEAIRGAWCLRDDTNLLLNFGSDKAGADQAVAVIHKYGFNRVGVIGAPAQPAMSYLFVSLEKDQPTRGPAGPAPISAQIDALTRTGIPIPGAGYTGEMVKIDPRKVEARKAGTEWVVMAGEEVLGRYGQTEWAARDAARTVRDANFTEYCKLGGTSNVTFFLHDGKAPGRAPIGAQGRSFDPTTLKVQQLNGKWTVTEGSRPLFDVSSSQEGETVVRVLKAYGFDQFANLTAGGTKGGITYLVKNR